MAANTPTVRKFTPFNRDGISPYIYPAAQWVDNLVLGAGVAKSYTLPTGVNTADIGGASATATIFRITAAGGPVWLNANGGTAAIPTVDVLDGSASVVIPESLEYWLSIPAGKQPLSFISAVPVSLAIEAWY